MSIQFGRWNFDGQSVDREYIARVQTCLAPYAPDSTTVCLKGAFFLLYAPFHTTIESREERQPSISPAGTYLLWNGRLDNRAELLRKLNHSSGQTATDLEIVSSSYEKEGTEAFAGWVGDWSLSVLDHYARTLVLAVDFVGALPLYYLRCDRYVAWSSVLEPLVVLAGHRFTLCEEYVAGWLQGFPAADLTPYKEIHAVPPGSLIEINHTAAKIRKYWEFNSRNPVRFRSDGEYEEAFRHLFTQAVRRRLPSNRPVVSELSGGMDSSSIVCVADRVLLDDPCLAPRLDTLSFLDDTEPDWNERPFITEVEAGRGRSGFHIDVKEPLAFIPEREPELFSSTPATAVVPSVSQLEVSAYLRKEGFRVVLSGLGGDECTGGVPDGAAELSDLLVQARIGTFIRQSVAWCLASRRPLIQLAASVVRGFLPQRPFGPSLLLAAVPWLNKEFEKRNRGSSACRRPRLQLHGALPSVQENLQALDELRRQIACAPLQLSPRRERRYPFLDRDLLEFLYVVPREQIVRPGRRRSLMRRAFRGIVPEAVLERKRKAYVARAPLKSFQAQLEELTAWTKDMVCSEIGAIDLKSFRQTLVAVSRGHDSPLWRLSRTLELESWLRDPRVQSILCFGASQHFATPPGRLLERFPPTAIESPQLGKSE